MLLRVLPGLLVRCAAWRLRCIGAGSWCGRSLPVRAAQARCPGRADPGAALALVLAYELATWLIGVFTTDLPYGTPQFWLQIPFWNSFFLMVVLIWIQTGFAMVILSAALRGVPEDTIEAAIIDGANPFQIFFKIKVPQIMGTIVVVWTTITITVLKVFDIVRAMTGGQDNTQVLANYMYDQLFRHAGLGQGVCCGHDHPAAGLTDPDLERVERSP